MATPMTRNIDGGNHSSGNAKKISLAVIFGDVVVEANGAQITIGADGSIRAYTSGRVDAYTNAQVLAHPLPGG